MENVNIEEGLIKELSKKSEISEEIGKSQNCLKTLSVGDLWGYMVRYNKKLTDLLDEMGTVSQPDPWELECYDKYVKVRNINDIFSEISYTLYVMTKLENEMFKKI